MNNGTGYVRLDITVLFPCGTLKSFRDLVACDITSALADIGAAYDAIPSLVSLDKSTPQSQHYTAR